MDQGYMSVGRAELLSEGFLDGAGAEIDYQPTTRIQNKNQYPPLTS
jgi:hypothetical protein